MAKVKVGCKLPHGIILELGYTVDKDSNLTYGETYTRVRLNGTNSNLVKGGLATREQPPGITLVEESVIGPWLEKNKRLGFVKSKLIYLIKNDAEGAAIAIDQSRMKTGFEPLKQSDVPLDSDGKPMIEKDPEAGSKG